MGALFGAYLVLWRAKRMLLIRQTGEDPDVLERSARPLQRYFSQMLRLMTAAFVVLLVGHAFGMAWPGFVPLARLESRWADHLGLAIGVFGLALCYLAQRTMGSAWRVGIDEQHPTPLVQRGIYAFIRNPTYLGLFLVNGGLWLIWPTATVTTFVVVFFVLMEVQVRCEEEYLEAAHRDVFRLYRSRTRRYLPFVY